MQLHDLLGDVDVAEHVGDPHVEVSAVTHDSRHTTPGALFCCIPGAVTDGHDHAAAAVAAGAVALLVERRLDLPVAQARVRTVREAVGPVAARFFTQPSLAMRVLGVTGTNGKTTTTHLIEAIATAAGERAGIIGTLGVRIAGASLPTERTTPEATELQALLARMREDRVETVAMEVSSHALDQHRVDGTRFAAACFTNLSHDHLDYHGSVDAYFAAKARLFTPAFTNAAALSLDDPRGSELARRAARSLVPVRTFSLDRRDADIHATNLRLTGRASAFTLVDAVSGNQGEVHSPLVARFNVANALGAAATALVAGLSFEAVINGLETRVVVPGRLERIDVGQLFSVLVDYAHTPEALDLVLASARELAGPGKRVILVFGCGGDRDRDKRPLMGQAAAAGADRAVLTSDNPRSEAPEAIADAVLAGVHGGRTPVSVELDRRAAIRLALHHADTGDVVVIAGKGHEPGQTARGVTLPFDDRAVAREELEALACPH